MTLDLPRRSRERPGERAARSLEVAVWDALAGVADPEIPAVSVVDMGMIRSRRRRWRTRARVVVLPTFTGCPAIAVIIERRERRGRRCRRRRRASTVDTSFDPPWTTDRITEEGREKLKEFGLAPPTGNGPGADHRDRIARRCDLPLLRKHRTRGTRTRSGRPRAGRSTTAATAATRSSSSNRSSGRRQAEIGVA